MRVYSLGIFILTFVCGCQNVSSDQKAVLTESEKQEIISKGKIIAGQTFTALSTRLQEAIQEGGVENAVHLCNLEAYPITDSLSKKHEATIKRTTLKMRNMKNKASEAEKQILQDFKQNHDAGKDLIPIVKRNDDGTVGFYAPIKTSSLCLKCHGTLGESMTEEDYKFISRYYPEDLAVDYQEGDLRGMWSITFQNDMIEN
jgi:hypothetical protein